MRNVLPLRAALFVMVLASSVGRARADGDEAFGEFRRRSGPGIGAVSVGVGLAGRRDTGPAVPTTTANIVVAGVPAGATVLEAQLYWVVFGSPTDDSVTLDGMPITGALIGTSADTCWRDFPATERNRVYRADVSALVRGNGTYVLGGFPSAQTMLDSQGASLVVLYQDPSVTSIGTVLLMDGAITLTGTGSTTVITFPRVTAAATTSAATLHLGVGDGQSLLRDMIPRFGGTPLPTIAGGFYQQRAGAYWDVIHADVAAAIPAGTNDIVLTNNYLQDCLVYAYAALEWSTPSTDGDGDGVIDAADNCPAASNVDQRNSDTDLFGDACDNCVLRTNPDQQDTDRDGVGDACDGCVHDADPEQTNSDGDIYTDVCDNCPTVTNPEQVDSNGDGIGDACEGMPRPDAGIRGDAGTGGSVDAGQGPRNDGGSVPSNDGGALDASGTHLSADAGALRRVNESGCGCHVPAAGAKGSEALAVFAMLMMVARRRRRGERR